MSCHQLEERLGIRNSKLNQRLANWSDADGTGIAFDSSTGFQLPNGAFRSPDAAWVRLDRWEALTPEQRRKFPPLAPDFVVELRSLSDDLKPLQAKMQEYRDNGETALQDWLLRRRVAIPLGVRLGWLIDPQNQQVEIYRQRRDVEVLESPATLSGEDVLPGFVLDLGQILS